MTIKELRIGPNTVTFWRGRKHRWVYVGTYYAAQDASKREGRDLFEILAEWLEWKD